MEVKSLFSYWIKFGLMVFIGSYLKVTFGKPFTNCGGTIRVAGSFINLKESVHSPYTCTWFLQPLQGQKLYARVESFSIKSETSKELQRLEIRTNQTSEDGMLHTFFGKDQEELNSQPDVGFLHDGTLFLQYIGSFDPDVDQLSVVIASFFVPERHGCSLFSCNNGRCIAPRLICDTHDHCGDMSDERTSICHSVKLKPFNNQTPDISKGNYSEPTATMFGVVTMSTLGVLFTILICVSLFRRNCDREDSATPTPQMTVATVQGIGAYSNRLNAISRIDNFQTPEDIPPPSYCDVIKSKYTHELPPSYNSVIHTSTPYPGVATIETINNFDYPTSPVYQLYSEIIQNQQNLNLREGILNTGYLNETISQGQQTIVNELPSSSSTDTMSNTLQIADQSSSNEPENNPAVLLVSSEVCFSRNVIPSIRSSEVICGPFGISEENPQFRYSEDSRASQQRF